MSTGEQTDTVWDEAPHHTLRAGFQVTGERNVTATDSSALPAADDGDTPAASDQPFTIHQGLGKTGGLYGLYVQNEWHVPRHLIVNYSARYDVIDE